jgi:hypothetical protein
MRPSEAQPYRNGYHGKKAGTAVTRYPLKNNIQIHERSGRSTENPSNNYTQNNIDSKAESEPVHCRPSAGDKRVCDCCSNTFIPQNYRGNCTALPSYEHRDKPTRKDTACSI